MLQKPAFNMTRWALLAIALIVSMPVLSQPFIYVASVTENNVSVVDGLTNSIVATVSVGSAPQGVAVSPTGEHIYVVNRDDDTVTVIDRTIGAVSATIAVGALPYGAVVSPDASRVYVSNRSNSSVSVIDANSNTVINTVPVSTNSPFSMTISSDGAFLLLTHPGSSLLTRMETATGDTSPVPGGSKNYAVVLAADEQRAYTTDSDNDRVTIIDLVTESVAGTIDVGATPTNLAINHAGDRLYVANHASTVLSVIDISGHTEIDTVDVCLNANGVAITPDDRYVYVLCYNSATVEVVDTQTHTVVETISVPNNPSSAGHFIRPLADRRFQDRFEDD